MDKPWKDQLKERFSDFTLPEPEGLWEGIEEALPRRRRIAPVWWWGGSAAAAAAVTAVVLLHPLRTQAPDPVQPVAVVEDSLAIEVPASPLPETSEEAPVEPLTVQLQRLRPRMAALLRQEPAPETMPVTLPAEEEALPVQEEALPEQEAPISGSGTSFQPENQQVPEELPLILPTTPMPRKSFRPSLTVGVQGSGVFGSATSSGEHYGMAPAYAASAQNGRANSPALMRMVSAGKNADYQDRHLAPLRAGLSLKAHFSPHWAVETGAVVSLLRSTFQESNPLMEQETVQHVYMLGVPLKLAWGFQPVKTLNLYAAAGVMGEKCLAGKSTLYTTLGGATDMRFTEENPLDKSGFYWSAGLDLGAEWRMAEVVGLYLEPGLWYHFPAHTELRTSYSAHPLSFSLTAGLRFHLGR